MEHRCELTVRGYELDSFGHVNNAVYLHYLEQARWEIARDRGLLEYFAETGRFPVVVDVRLRYLRETRVFDNLTVVTTMRREPPYLVFRHRILRSGDGLPVARGTVKMIIVDADRIPQDIPDFMAEG